MRKDLVTTFKNLHKELIEKENHFRKNNEFLGAAYIEILVNDTIGKGLNLEKNDEGSYVIDRFSTNGALAWLEDELTDLQQEFKTSTSGYCSFIIKTIML